MPDVRCRQHYLRALTNIQHLSSNICSSVAFAAVSGRGHMPTTNKLARVCITRQLFFRAPP